MQIFVSHSLQETASFATQIAQQLPVGSVLALVGDLGSGKTTFLQYFLNFWGVPRDEVLSPTFVIEHIYQTQKFPIHHYDFYRLKSLGEVYELGIDEVLSQNSGIVLVEWANLFPQILPAEYFLLEATLIDETSRAYQFQKVIKK
jgi:tRNA threonylcarbamoyladenosine biosynthesis protein TsaE